jgi:hypothetical protein
VNKDDFPKINTSNKKQCSACGLFKANDQYFSKRCKLESYCKACKQEKRKSHSTASKSQVELTSPDTVTLSVDISSTAEPNHTNIEPESSPKPDFWEKKYKRPLGDSDKLEIKLNMRSLIALLVDKK